MCMYSVSVSCGQQKPKIDIIDIIGTLELTYLVLQESTTSDDFIFVF